MSQDVETIKTSICINNGKLKCLILVNIWELIGHKTLGTWSLNEDNYGNVWYSKELIYLRILN